MPLQVLGGEPAVASLRTVLTAEQHRVVEQRLAKLVRDLTLRQQLQIPLALLIPGDVATAVGREQLIGRGEQWNMDVVHVAQSVEQILEVAA